MREHIWIRQILDGDGAAGRRFVTAYYPRVYALLRRLTGRVEVAEDLTQQTFLKAWRALPSFRGQASLATWLHQIAYREYAHWLRERREHQPLTAALDVPAASTDPVEDLVFREALELLPQESGDAFILYYVHGLTVAETAAVIGIPPGTVKWRLSDARRRLRRLLGDPREVAKNDVPQAQCE